MKTVPCQWLITTTFINFIHAMFPSPYLEIKITWDKSAKSKYFDPTDCDYGCFMKPMSQVRRHHQILFSHLCFCPESLVYLMKCEHFSSWEWSDPWSFWKWWSGALINPPMVWSMSGVEASVCLLRMPSKVIGWSCRVTFCFMMLKKSCYGQQKRQNTLLLYKTKLL